MFIKIRTTKVPKYRDYLTAGKIYDCDTISNDDDFGYIVNDKGRTNLVYLPVCAHLDGASWEVVSSC